MYVTRESYGITINGKTIKTRADFIILSASEKAAVSKFRRNESKPKKTSYKKRY